VNPPREETNLEDVRELLKMRWAKKMGNVFLGIVRRVTREGRSDQTIASPAIRVNASGSTLRNFIPLAY
jgi:hypothetical protein